MPPPPSCQVWLNKDYYIIHIPPSSLQVDERKVSINILSKYFYVHLIDLLCTNQASQMGNTIRKGLSNAHLTPASQAERWIKKI